MTGSRDHDATRHGGVAKMVDHGYTQCMSTHNVVRRTKTALVLAGGGLTGAVYEIGALRAMDDLLLDRSVNDFDIYVGTSAGALVSTFLAQGVSPHEIMDALAGEHAAVPPLQPRDLFSLSRRDW